MDIIGQRTIFYSLSGALILASALAIAIFGLRLGIDFTGGSILEVEFPGARPPAEILIERLAPLNLGELRLRATGERGFFIRLRSIDAPTHQKILEALGEGVSDKPENTFGPAIGRELWRKSMIAVSLVILLIVSYLAWAFRKVSLPLPSWKYGLTAVIALVHDVLIPTGLFAVAGHFSNFEVDTLFVTAILTILGFSVHDTIVVFDRIRENLKKDTGHSDFPALVNRSVNETFVRSINTSLTVILALAAVYVFGGPATNVFSLTLIIGIIIGTYSSICIASPLLVSWYEYQRHRNL